VAEEEVFCFLRLLSFCSFSGFLSSFEKERRRKRKKKKLSPRDLVGALVGDQPAVVVEVHFWKKKGVKAHWEEEEE